MKLRRQAKSLFTDVLCRLWAVGMGCTLLGWIGCTPSLDAPGSGQVPWSVDSLTLGNVTPTWQEAVEMCQALASSDARVTLHEVGTSDVGRPIHALVVTENQAVSRSKIDGVDAVKERLANGGTDKVRVLVNNAIHPGEPCGVNASLALVQTWLNMPNDDSHPLATSSWVFIPQYNVGGASRRNCCTRANQEGPESYGFRGNAANLDLNRDFIKMDSRNAEAFVSLFRAMDPDVFVDTHTSNGADYPYTMTLITSQEDKAGPVLGPFLRDKMTPALNKRMLARGWPMVPYVYSKGQTPDQGIVGFLETPRYSTGYATLWGTLGFTTEAHMLKPFADRVQSTLAFLEELSAWLSTAAPEVKAVRLAERKRVTDARSLPVRWALSKAQKDSILFSGFEAQRAWSPVTGGTRLRYNRDSVWTRAIPFDNRYDVVAESNVPRHWVLPQAWRRVQKRLAANGVVMTRVASDTVVLANVVTVESFRSAGKPYEGHHPLTVDSVSSTVLPVQLYAGDWLIPSDQEAKRYLVEVLDPMAHDALLVWNFFDAALQQKEYYSGYVFEDTAEDMLDANPALRSRFDAARSAHPEWADNPGLALRWLYQESPHNEGTANRYPVYALN